MLPVATPSSIRDSDLIIVRGVSDKIGLRASSRTRRPALVPIPESPSGRQLSGMEGGLSVTTFALILALTWALWQWRKTQETEQSAREEASLSWNFADDVLTVLKEARSENAALDTSRRDLIHTLRQMQEDGESSKRLLDQWKQAHTELAAVSQQTVAQWSNYSQNLEHNLGSTRAALTDTSSSLERERLSAQHQISQLDSAKTAVEREADAFARKAQSLERAANELDQRARSLGSDKQALEADVCRLRSCLADLERRYACLTSDNVALANANSQLSREISCLRSKISVLESKANSHDRDHDRH